jgi:hypothetical protein
MPDPNDVGVPAPTNPQPLMVGLQTLYDNWKAAYRGLQPHGISKPAPYIDEYTEPETFNEAEAEEPTTPDSTPDPLPFSYKNVIPIPIVIIDDLHSTRRTSDTYFTAYQENVQAVNPQLIVNRHNDRVSVRLSNNGPGIIYLGHNESVLRGGYAMAVNEALTMTTTRDIWAIQQTAQSGPAALSVMYEYDREIEK